MPWLYPTARQAIRHNQRHLHFATGRHLEANSWPSGENPYTGTRSTRRGCSGKSMSKTCPDREDADEIAIPAVRDPLYRQIANRDSVRTSWRLPAAAFQDLEIRGQHRTGHHVSRHCISSLADIRSAPPVGSRNCVRDRYDRPTLRKKRIKLLSQHRVE